MYNIIPLGSGGGECFLLMSETYAALIDSGFSFAAPELAQKIKDTLKTRPLNYILLSHSHYDHAGGAPYFKRVFPESEVIASSYAAYVFTRPGAQNLIREMTEFAASSLGYCACEDFSASLAADRTVEEGDSIDMGSFTLKVIASPGHTKCSISYYSPEEKLLIASETLGVPGDEGVVAPCCLVSYDDTITSIKKAAALDIESILFPHSHLEKGKEACQRFFDLSLSWHEKTRAMLREAKENGQSEEDMVAILKKYFYTEVMRKKQPEKAFYLNSTYIIKCMLA